VALGASRFGDLELGRSGLLGLIERLDADSKVGFTPKGCVPSQLVDHGCFSGMEAAFVLICLPTLAPLGRAIHAIHLGNGGLIPRDSGRVWADGAGYRPQIKLVAPGSGRSRGPHLAGRIGHVISGLEETPLGPTSKAAARAGNFRAF